MERVAFLLESSGERLTCLLNPNSLVMRRVSGVQPRRSAGGGLTGIGLTDDPLLYTGGGRTELDLDLLFDVRLAGSSVATPDVRELTQPLWKLAENASGADRYGRPPQVRFVWGKAWNILGVVTAVAERLEDFTAEGAAQRSWLRLRLLRVTEPPAQLSGTGAIPGVPAAPQLLDNLEDIQNLPLPDSEVTTYTITGGGEAGTAGEAGDSERLDQVSAGTYHDPDLWRLLAAFNGIDDPLHLDAGMLLRIPSLISLAAHLRSV